MSDCAIVECFEFSMKSRIEFDRVDFKFDALEFFFEIEKTEIDALSKDLYDRDAKLKFEFERAFNDFSSLDNIEINAELD
jgi:hypothetical protein